MIYRNIIRPFAFRLDPEKTHQYLIDLGRSLNRNTPVLALLRSIYKRNFSALNLNVFNIDFPNPVGLAAGLDKNAELIPFLSAFGFGHLEVGSISAFPHTGNPRPRLFRLPKDRALINRMGLNNRGARHVIGSIPKPPRSVPIGINLVNTPQQNASLDVSIDDFRDSFNLLYPLADYITLNISCPNTAEGKTFEDVETLGHLLDALGKEQEDIISKNSTMRKKPVLIKLSLDLDSKDLSDITRTAISRKIVSGFVVGNTSIDRSHLKTNPFVIKKIGDGGLSGRPIRDRSTTMIKQVYALTRGDYPIIGVGGIFYANEAYEKIKAGASLVQVYTGLVYQGPSLVKSISKGLIKLLKKDGFSNISEAIGISHKL